MDATLPFKISLAEWSLHNMLFKGELDNLDFARVAREEFDIDGIEYVNGFFKDKAKDSAYINEMKKRAADHGVTSVLIMCDGEGNLGDPDDAKRAQAVENHRKWIEAAVTLGCHSIRVNAASSGTWDEQQKLAADGLSRLCEIGQEHKINVIVENHGGLSSNGAWLSGVMRMVDHPRCGTLPDFGNFCMDWSKQDDPKSWYDRYEGVTEMMPFARAVSAKTHDFDDKGDEARTDYYKMMKIVTDAGYDDFVGIEYEGSKLGEFEGVRASLKLLKKIQAM